MSDVITVTVYVRTDKIGSRCTREIEFDAEEWADMSESEKDEVCRETMFEMIEWGFNAEVIGKGESHG